MPIIVVDSEKHGVPPSPRRQHLPNQAEAKEIVDERLRSNEPVRAPRHDIGPKSWAHDVVDMTWHAIWISG